MSGALAGSSADFAKLIADATEKWGQGDAGGETSRLDEANPVTADIPQRPICAQSTYALPRTLKADIARL